SVNSLKSTYTIARYARIAISLAVMIGTAAALTMGFDCWLSRWQMIPALATGTGIWLLVWLAVTLLFGRLYCSTACPLGTLQDCISRINRRRVFGFTVPYPLVRWCTFFIGTGAFVLGIATVSQALDPAAGFNRLVTAVAGPLGAPLAYTSGTLIAAAATLIIIATAAYRRGRLICNTICPIGTITGALSVNSVFHMDINPDKCLGCGRCSAGCKSECIDHLAHTIDLTRCVVCFDCAASCPSGAITFRRGRHQLQIPLLREVLPEAMRQPGSSVMETSKPD
ncbi:MAG: 4Fe-4S binding protein, partial [Muribaculaceae bacterium]|nr:4Fe-4S binding protein [Muribaculaceae bacterium]